MQHNGVAVNERIRARPAAPVVASSWFLIVLQCLVLLLTFVTWGMVHFEGAPAKAEREREREIIDAAALLEQREADLLVQQAESVRLAKELNERLKGESK